MNKNVFAVATVAISLSGNLFGFSFSDLVKKDEGAASAQAVTITPEQAALVEMQNSALAAFKQSKISFLKAYAGAAEIAKSPKEVSGIKDSIAKLSEVPAVDFSKISEIANSVLANKDYDSLTELAKTKLGFFDKFKYSAAMGDFTESLKHQREAFATLKDVAANANSVMKNASLMEKAKLAVEFKPTFDFLASLKDDAVSVGGVLNQFVEVAKANGIKFNQDLLNPEAK